MMKNNRKIIYIAGFLFSIPIALTSYINSSFLEGYVNAYYVSIAYVVASLISIISMLEMPLILTRIGNRATSLLFGSLIFASYLGLAFSSNVWVILTCFVAYLVSSHFVMASLDIFIEDFSKGSSIGSIRGLYLMFINSAWVISQLISGSIISKSSYQGIYLFAAGFMILFGLIFALFLHDFKDPKYKKVPIIQTIKIFTKDDKISKIYFINFILRFFFAWMVIYTPIYLHTYMGFDWSQIGIIFSIMLLPFVLLDLPLGLLSDKIGEKKLLILGFLIAALATVTIPLLDGSSLILWAFILFMTRVGAATLEVMSESYFFKCVSEEDDDEISFFRNTGPLSYVVAPLVALPVLYFIPSFKYLFVVLTAVLLAGMLVSIRLRDVK